MAARGGTAATAQHPLAAHEFAVVFAEVAGERTEAGISTIGAAGPFPDIAEQLADASALPCLRMQLVVIGEVAFDRLRGGGRFPFEFGGQAGAGPACAGIGFVVAEMTDRCVRIELAPATQGELAQQVVVPVQRMLPLLGLTQRPALAQPPAWIAVTTRVDEGAVLGLSGRSASACAGSSTRCTGDSLS